MAAFRSTLEELHEADLLLHVIDISNPDYEEHITAVEKIFEQLDIADKPVLKIFNKADLFSDKDALQFISHRHQAIAVSALDRASLGPLVERIEISIPKPINNLPSAEEEHYVRFESEPN